MSILNIPGHSLWLLHVVIRWLDEDNNFLQPAGHAPPSVAHYAVCLTVRQNIVLAQIWLLFVPCDTQVFSSRAATQPVNKYPSADKGACLCVHKNGQVPFSTTYSNTEWDSALLWQS